MSTHKYIDKICIAVLVLALLLTAVFMNGEKLGIQVIQNEDSETSSGSSYFTENDLDGTWDDNAYTTYISLDSSGGKIKGSGAYFLDGDLVISNGGWYVISGSLDDGKIIVDADNSSKIWIRLNGVTLNCSDDACLRIDQADKVFLTLAEGTENSFTSGSTYSDEALSDNTGGTIFSHDDLTINGSGSLSITAEYKHGIDANDSLVITGGNITITAPQDGVHVNDSFRFTEASLTVDAGDDGIHSDKELYVESGTILINSCVEGLEALTIDVAGGDITVYPTDDGFNANGGTSNTMGGGMGGPPDMSAGERPSLSEDTASESASGEESTTTESTKSAEAMTTVASGEAMTGSETTESTESTEAMPTFASGEATTGSGTTDTTESTEEETYIRISGGKITIINGSGNDADGLDSNGSIYIDGGEIYISLVGQGSNSALDYGSESGGELVVTGGTVMAFGASSMAEEFSESSTQPAVLYNLESAIEGGTTFQVLNSSGEEVLSYTPANSYSSVSFSSPALSLGESYTLVSGETTAEVTLESVATTSGSSGGMGGMGGGSGQGGGPQMHSGEDRASSSNMGGGPGQGGGAPGMSSEGNPASSSTMPGQSSDSNMPSGQPGGDGGGFSPEQESSTEESTTVSTNLVSLEDLDKSVWVELGASVIILLAGLFFAIKYRKH